MTVLLSPIFNVPSFQDGNGNPLSGGKIFQYQAGSNSVLRTTFTSDTGLTANANPIVLDSSGTLPNAIWLTEGQAYNLVLTAADGTTVLKGFDDVTGITGSIVIPGATVAVWVTAGVATFLTSTSFRVVGNKTSEYAVGNRVRVTQSGGFTYGVVTARTFASPNTTVTIQNDGAVLNSSLSLADYSILSASPGATVDAGGVSFFDALPYATTNTVGWKINQVEVSVTAVGTIVTTNETKAASDRKVWWSSGSGTNTPYAVALAPAITSYTADQLFTVKFQSPSIGNPTINFNSVGAVNLKAYSSTGTLVAPLIADNMVSDVVFDGTQFILLDSLPIEAETAAATPRGMRTYGTNNTFTTPANVYYIKITCVGGGGQGGISVGCGDIETGFTSFAGGRGGYGEATEKYIATTPGTTYTVAIGAGGNDASAGIGGTTSFGITIATAVGGRRGGGASCSGGEGGLGTGGFGGVGTLRLRGGAISYGDFGSGGFSESPGNSGLCVVEW